MGPRELHFSTHGREPYILCIFEINGFYVEAIYSKQNNRVNAILPIMGMESWEAYVDQVIRNVTEVN